MKVRSSQLELDVSCPMTYNFKAAAAQADVPGLCMYAAWSGALGLAPAKRVIVALH